MPAILPSPNPKHSWEGPIEDKVGQRENFGLSVYNMLPGITEAGAGPRNTHTDNRTFKIEPEAKESAALCRKELP